MPIPPADHLGAVTRGLHTVERDGQPMKVLTAERTYPALPEEVWDAITDPERIPRWIGGAVTGDLRLGGRYQIEGNAGGEILECEPPKRLALTWEYDGTTWVDATLVSVGDGTLLHLEHTAPVPPEMWAQFGPGAVGIGWESMLMGLAEHLAAPDADMDALRTWLEGPEGRPYLVEFMTGSSDHWVEASIAFGTDPDEARAAGERCAAAYTAEPEPASE